MTKRVLCVDDDADVCEIVALILDDFEVVSVHGIGEAYRRFRSETFDLILIDSRFSDDAGFELCNRIRLIDSKTPILFVSGAPWVSSTPWIREPEALQVGAQGLIKKDARHFVTQLRARAALLTGEDPKQIRYMELSDAEAAS